jgi:hypothetical protein
MREFRGERAEGKSGVQRGQRRVQRGQRRVQRSEFRVQKKHSALPWELQALNSACSSLTSDL